MRSLVPIPLIFLAAALPGCAANHSPPGTAPTQNHVETGNGQTLVVAKLIDGPVDVAHEGCGGR